MNRGLPFPTLGFAGDGCVEIRKQLPRNSPVELVLSSSLHWFWGLHLGCQACGAKWLYPLRLSRLSSPVCFASVLTIEPRVLYMLGRCAATELHICT